MLESLQMGNYYGYHKKQLDKYYDESEHFRKHNENYHKWEGDYE